MKGIVLGAAGGIGKEVVREMTFRCSEVIGYDRQPSDFEAPNYRHYTMSVGPVELPDSKDASWVVSTMGVIDGGYANTVSPGRYTKIIQANLEPIYAALLQLYPRLMPHASIVLTSSVSARFAESKGTAYASAKAGLEALVRGLAREWAPIRVNAVAPGPTLTHQYLTNVSPESQERDASRSPHGRNLEPIEVALAIMALLNLTGVSGAVLPVDLAGSSSGRR